MPFLMVLGAHEGHSDCSTFDAETEEIGPQKRTLEGYLCSKQGEQGGKKYPN